MDPERRWGRAVLRHPLAGPMIVGAVLRLLAAVSGWGWFAPDDLTYVIDQGGRWLEDPGALFPSDIRSVWLPRAFWMLMLAGRHLGLSEPTGVLQLAYAGLGLWSLAAVPGTYLLTRRRLGEPAARACAWLMAAFALMPRICTRGLIEVVVIPPLVWALVILDSLLSGRRGRTGACVLAAGVLLGTATLIRYQVGLLFVSVGLLALWHVRAESSSKGWTPGAKAVAALAVGVAFWAVAQGVHDHLLDRQVLSTPIGYLRHNLANASRFGVSPWYTYLLHLVALTAPPATFVLARPMWRAARRHPTVSLSLLLFVTVHSVIGHKEDRFLFPALPLLFVLLGAALAEARHGTRWQVLGARFFWIANAGALVIATGSDAQRNWTEPLVQIASADAHARVGLVGIKASVSFYAGPKADLVARRNTAQLVEHVAKAGWRPDRILYKKPPTDEDLARLTHVGLHCREEAVYRGDGVDRALYALNPRRNRRRRPSTMLACREQRSAFSFQRSAFDG